MEYIFTISVTLTTNANNLLVAKDNIKKLISDKFGGNMLGYTMTCDFQDIMNFTNGHNRNLVRLINYCYNYNNENFNAIVNTLANRDDEECEEKGIIFPIKIGSEYDYLMEVADDEDLKTIISFVRPRDSDGNIMTY